MSLAGEGENRMKQSIDTIVRRIFVYLAFIASGVLYFFAYLMIVEAAPLGTDAQGAAAFIGVCFSPIWLMSAVLSAIFGWQLGGAWRLVGWLPLLLGILVIIWALQY